MGSEFGPIDDLLLRSIPELVVPPDWACDAYSHSSTDCNNVREGLRWLQNTFVSALDGRSCDCALPTTAASAKFGTIEVGDRGTLQTGHGLRK